jgi:Base plate wedge protein 53
MKYFDTIPSITTFDSKGNGQQLKNLILRTKLIPELSQNPLIFYDYAVQEGDTPEIIAYKYYGDSYRYWIVLIANEMMNPSWNWPLDTRQFTAYLIDKYTTAANGQNVLAYTQATTHHYEKIITTYDDSVQTTVIKNIIVDEDTYNSIIPTSTSASFPNENALVSYNVSKTAVSIFDYENNLNESKRNIKLINADYVADIENQFSYLMSL